MGSLIINKVKYFGDKYFFESPSFGKGINVIEGDNGSGKSTFLYLVEYCLGGNVKYFNRNNKTDKYTKITNDTNNYVELYICLNCIDYKIKRFFGTNDVFVDDGIEVKRWFLNRQSSPEIFSDWLLGNLDIDPFELNLGAKSWVFNFNDIFRLLNYDQDTEPRKIFKSPTNENFVTDSSVIRKSTFESLIGISSNDYFAALNEYNRCKRERAESKILYERHKELYPGLDEDFETVSNELEELESRLDLLTEGRDKYQSENTYIDDKIIHIEEVNSQLVTLELGISDIEIKKKNLQIEKEKIQKIYEDINSEISQINKIIYTHNKLDLFSLEICPFCMNEIERKEGVCICGSELKKEDYEKFVYQPSEYQSILKHKQKSLETVNLALESYSEEILELETELSDKTSNSLILKEKIKTIISSIEFSGNSQLIDDYNERIIDVKEEIVNMQKDLRSYKELESLENDYNSSDKLYQDISKKLKDIEISYKSNNKKMIKDFNYIYNRLMSESSCKVTSAKIDDEYMPYIDDGEYKEKSATVPKRLMYYFTVFAMGLKHENVKHPKLLLIDTPETDGIDDNHLKDNIELFGTAIELSKESGINKNNEFQMILTTGIKKYPSKYEKYVKLRFNTTKNEFILKERDI